MQFDFTKVVFTGDSLVDEKTNQTITHSTSIEGGIGYDQWDSGCHWCYILSRVFNFEYVNSAVCGEKIMNICNNINSYILNYNPTFVFIDGGVNDIFNGISVSNTTNYMTQTIQTLLNKGIQVGLVWFPVTHSSMASLVSSYATMANTFKNNYPNQFVYFNFEGVTNFGTTSSSSSNIPQDYRRDGLHFNQAGYKATAEYMIQKIKEADSSLSDMQVEAGASVIIRG